VPTFTCGLFLSNFSLAISVSPQWALTLSYQPFKKDPKLKKFST
jgi:hypothetical protein